MFFLKINLLQGDTVPLIQPVGLGSLTANMTIIQIPTHPILIKVINLIPFPDPASFERGYAHELDEMESLEHVPIKNAAETLAWLREQAEQLLAEQSVEDGEVANEE